MSSPFYFSNLKGEHKMEDYKPNSHKYKERQQEHKEIKKVVTGEVKTKKKSGLAKLSDVFIAEDAKNVKSYIFMDVLVPAIKKGIADIVTGGVDMILFGGKRTTSGTGYSPSNISYRSYYNQNNQSTGVAPRTRTGYNYDDIILETREECETVLIRMGELIDMYGQVSVADLYDLVGKSSEYTDNNYGWTNIRNAEPVRVSNGYMLTFPKVVPMNKS